MGIFKDEMCIRLKGRPEEMDPEEKRVGAGTCHINTCMFNANSHRHAPIPNLTIPSLSPLAWQVNERSLEAPTRLDNFKRYLTPTADSHVPIVQVVWQRKDTRLIAQVCFISFNLWWPPFTAVASFAHMRGIHHKKGLVESLGFCFPDHL